MPPAARRAHIPRARFPQGSARGLGGDIRRRHPDGFNIHAQPGGGQISEAITALVADHERAPASEPRR